MSHTHTVREDCAPGKRCCREEATYAGLLAHLKDGHERRLSRAEMGQFKNGTLSPVEIHHLYHVSDDTTLKDAP